MNVLARFVTALFRRFRRNPGVEADADWLGLTAAEIEADLTFGRD